MGFRAIERVTGISHRGSPILGTTCTQHRESDDNYEIPETAQIDELQTFIGSKKTKFGFGQLSIAKCQEF